jgi:hypothetical protein
MSGKFETFIYGLAKREHKEAARIAAEQLGSWQNIRLPQASRASLKIFAGDEINFGHNLDGITAARSHVPLLEQLILTPKLYVGLHAESETNLIMRYGVTSEQIDRVISEGFVVPDLFEYESQSESHFSGYETQAAYLIEIFEKWFDVARISPIRREYVLQAVGIDRENNRKYIDHYREDFLPKVSRSLDVEQIKRATGNPSFEWTLSHHLARLRSLVDADNAEPEAVELIQLVGSDPPSSTEELIDLYAATIFQTMDTLYEVQYFGAPKRWYRPHLDLFTDPLDLPQGKIDEIRDRAQEILQQQQFAEFLGRLARIRDAEFSERQEPRFEVYPLPMSEFEEMLSLLKNVRNNSLVLGRLVRDMEAVRTKDATLQENSYFQTLEQVIVEIRESKIRDEAKKVVLRSLLAWSVSTVLSMPWLDSIDSFLADKGAALAGSLTPATQGLLFRPRRMKKYPIKAISAETRLRIIGDLESLTGKSTLL